MYYVVHSDIADEHMPYSLMKLRARDYFSVFYDLLIKRPVKLVWKKLRYMAELHGRHGYEVNGIDGYWGRYANVSKIIELANSLKSEDDWFTFYFPAARHNGKYSHRIGIYGSALKGVVDFEFLDSGSQCGSYFKRIALDDLESEIRNLPEIEKSPESHGFVYEES